jgi:hypothetical protein
MMAKAETHPYITRNPALGIVSFLPILPITLALQQKSIRVQALPDTAATVNVLPFDLGIQLGANWDNQHVPVQLTGNLAKFDARGLLIIAHVGNFAPVQLAFAWTKSNDVPILLGQVNFFMEFDVCFFRSRLTFELRPKTDNTSAL